jgi:hypothetical protein
MPRVPLSQGAQLQSTAQQGGYLRAPDVSQTARTLANSLGQAGDALNKEIYRQGETEANKADTEIAQGWMQWDAEARRKYQGENAERYREEAAKWWEEAGTKYGEAMNPVAKGMIGQALGRRKATALGNVAAHVEGEKEKFADQSASAAIDTNIQAGVTSGDVAGAAMRVREITASIAVRKGWTTEQLQAEQGKHLSNLHLAQITSLASKDAAAAQSYFDANKAEVDFKNQNRVQEVLKAEGDNQAARQSAAAWAPLPYEEQLKKASEITDPQRREKTLQQLQLNHGMVKAARQEVEAKAADTAWQMVAQGQRVPEAILGGMDGRERVQLKDYLRQRAEHAATQGAKPVKTDEATHRRLWALMGDDPEAFKRERLDAHGMKLSGADFEQLVKLQAGMRSPAKEPRDVVTWQNKVTSRLEMQGISTGAAREQQRGQFRRAAQQEFEAFEARTGKKPSPKDEDEILDRLQLPGSVAWFSGNAATYAEAKATGKPFEPKVERADRELITKALKAEGIASPTDEQITARFKLAKGIK